MKGITSARGGRATILLVLLAVAALVVAGCGSSNSKGSSTGGSGGASAGTNSACKGSPVTIDAIANLSSPDGQVAPEVPSGVKAAGAALTKSCELGGPVHVNVCNDAFNPNSDAKCGRQAVSDKPVAVITYGSFPDSYLPEITAAGIPVLPVNAASSTENTSKLSFPFGYPITSLVGQIGEAAGTGGKKLALFALGIPSVKFFVQIAQKEAASLGIKLVSSIAVPPTATDMTSYVGQALSAGADSFVSIIGPSQQTALFMALIAQGVSFKKDHVVSSLLTLTPAEIKELGPGAEGLLMNSWAWSPAVNTKPYVSQYLSELAAAGQPHAASNVDMVGLEAWAELHVLADALKAGNMTPSAANAIKALNGPNIMALTTKYGVVPIDFTKPALPGPLAKLRLFSLGEWDWYLNSQDQIALLSSKVYNAFAPEQISRPSS
jgi:ABC-type branched-subunit amino acid transport system substrate-binding protein